MDLEKFSLKQLYLAAMASEIGASRVYGALARAVKNSYMKDKLLFLAGEEVKHRRGLERLYRKEAGVKRIVVPKETPVPLPGLKEPGPGVQVSEVLESAMAAEKAAEDFYISFARRYPAGSEEAWLLTYFANMERGHFKLLENERDLMTREEFFDVDWPMMHSGP